jgi:large conductance mechanosensitive channel
MLKEFQEFALKGNVLDMAVGIVIGVAFGTIITSLVNDVLMPPIGMLLGGVDFSDLYIVLSAAEAAPGPYASLAAAREAGAVVIAYGLFVNAMISFVIVAFAVFMLVRSFNRVRRAAEPETEAEAPPAEAEPSAEVRLLGEIRDLLKAAR